MCVMQIQFNNKYNNPNFGIMFSKETVRRANQACIERGKLARLQGLTLNEYNALHRQDFVHKIGGKTFDLYELTEKLTSNKEKLKEAFSKAWNTILGNKGNRI